MRFSQYIITAIAFWLPSVTEVSAQTAPTPFPCNGQLYQIATRNSTLKALNFVETANGYTTNFTDINSAGANRNAGWGFNDLDNLIYGVRTGTRDLWRIDFDGNFVLVATLDNTFERGSFVGDVLPNGVMIYRSRDDARVWQLVDLSDPANPVNNGTITLTSDASGADFAYNPVDGIMYGYDAVTNQLYYVDIASLLNGGGTATPQFFGPTTYTGGYGALWFDEDGRLYLYNNNNNEIIVANVGVAGNGTGNAAFLAVSTDEEGGTNDGAYCRGPAPVPLGSIKGTVFEDIDSDDMLGAGEPGVGAGVTVSVYYDNGTQANLADDTFIGTTETIADGTYIFDGLVTIETYRVEIDATDPDLPLNSNIGTSNPIIGVTVSTTTQTQDVNFGMDPGIADLEITKTANVTEALPGDTVIWTISVTNKGNGSPANVMVSDIIPDGFTYVSDDAPAVGDYYNPSNGNWFVDEILPNATETLNITTTANAGGGRTNYAEIVFSSMPDPDSDFNVGRLVTDGTDDDEAQFTVAEFGGHTVAGRIFLDNGAGAATAYDASLGGAETAGAFATVVVTDSGGTVLATPPINAAGEWIAALPFGYSGTLTVTASPAAGYLSVSEADPGLPALSNPGATDGTYTFTPASNASYTGLDFGLIGEPTLSQNQSVSLSEGQIANLAHRYEATATGIVDFSLVDVTTTPAGAFTSTFFRDINCDSAPDTPLSAPVSVEAGQSICLVVRTQASSGISDAAMTTYGIVAFTDFSGTGLSTNLRNDDVIQSASAGAITLRKFVTNITQNTPEGTSNTGTLGDTLQYRLMITNPNTKPISDIRVFDQTPAWTALSDTIPGPVTVAPGINCAVVIPANGGNSNYVGPIEWSCPGSFPPGGEGSLTFRVRIQ